MFPEQRLERIVKGFGDEETLEVVVVGEMLADFCYKFRDVED